MNEDYDIEIIVDNINILSDYLPVFCERCKKTMEQENKRQKFCKSCFTLNKLEYDRSYAKNKYREKKELS